MAHSICSISQVGKSRNGQPRYWCSNHYANATGKGGRRLDRCEAANSYVSLDNVFELDCERFEGGVGIWGALPPVYNTAKCPMPSGVHVHARIEADSEEKEIDQTYQAVKIIYKCSLFDTGTVVFTEAAAKGYFVSKLLGLELDYLFCPRCNHLHLDEGVFATKPHKKHLCNACGRYFSDARKSISNPVALLRKMLDGFETNQGLRRAEKKLDIKQFDHPGGIQIWASNPAILWTVPRPEHEGLHVHVYESGGENRLIDDTFASVKLDGIEIDEKMTRYLMAQNSLPYLLGRLDSITCPNCKVPHFDVGANAFSPHNNHKCVACSTKFSSPRRKKLVSNPIISLFEQLARLREGDA
jgi:transcription elongation factor Elf1